jgi:alpha-N-arabinofuranosidase
MYVPFQDALLLPIDFNAGTYKVGSITLPQIDALAARGKDGKIWLSLTNLDPNNAVDFAGGVQGVSASSAEGEVLTADQVDTVNSFDAPSAVAPKAVRFQASGGTLVVKLPPRSVTVVRLEP